MPLECTADVMATTTSPFAIVISPPMFIKVSKPIWSLG